MHEWQVVLHPLPWFTLMQAADEENSFCIAIRGMDSIWSLNRHNDPLEQTNLKFMGFVQVLDNLSFTYMKTPELAESG